MAGMDPVAAKRMSEQVPSHRSPTGDGAKGTASCPEDGENQCRRSSEADVFEAELNAIKNSFSYRLGCLLTETLRSPLKRFWKLPVRLLRLTLDYRRRYRKGGVPTRDASPASLRRFLKKKHPGTSVGPHTYRFSLFEEFKPLTSVKNSSLRIACVLGNHLQTCLDFEGHLLPLSLEMSREALAVSRPDLLLIEATRDFRNPEWQGVLSGVAEANAALRRVAADCRKLGIPTALWITADRSDLTYFELPDVSFDRVFVSDETSVDRVEQKLGKGRVSLLPPAVQPALHNPVRSERFVNHMREFSILFDGWADVLEWPDRFQALRHLSKHGLHIVESRYDLRANKLEDLPRFRKQVLGCVTYEQLLSALRTYRTCLLFEQSLSSPLSLARRALESAACGCNVLFRGKSHYPIPKDTVSILNSDTELVDYCVGALNNDELWSRNALIARRMLYSDHTYAHRVGEICRVFGLHHGWEEFPKVSVIATTKRPEYIERVLAAYKEQTYPNKELVLVLNVSHVSNRRIEEWSALEGVTVCQVHQEHNIGTCLNLGIERSQGRYWFKMDDDDHYSPNYVRDMVLALRAVDAQVFGKPMGFIYFESDETLRLRGSVFGSQHLAGTTVPSICGATLGGSLDIYDRIGFSETLRASVDTDFLERCKALGITLYAGDAYGFVAVRSKDKSRHTWRVSDRELRKTLVPVSKGPDFRNVLI